MVTRRSAVGRNPHTMNQGEFDIIGSVFAARHPAREDVRLGAVRDGDTVWVMADAKLVIKKVHVVLRDATYAYIRKGLSDKDQIVTTNLATVTDGARLRVEGKTAK